MRKLRTPLNRSVRRMLEQALKGATPTLRDIARDAGLSYPAVRMYVRGHRTPKPAVIAQLVRALRGRSAKLAKLAAQLETAARARTRGKP